MKKAIYKIENLINHKIYIGESKHPEIRFQQHCEKHNYVSLISEAIQKYGKEKFSFEIIGWYDDWPEKEQYYIQFYRSQAPYGYNIDKGGGEPPLLKGENHPACKISQQLAEEIINQILDWRIPSKTIIANNKITRNMFRHINEGRTWRNDKLNYPLRPAERVLNEYRAKYIQWMCCSSLIPLNQLGALVGWNKSAAKMINQGHNHFNANLKYPIRDNSEYNRNILNQETCIDYLRFGE